MKAYHNVRIEIKKAYNETSDAIVLSDGFFNTKIHPIHTSLCLLCDDDDDALALHVLILYTYIYLYPYLTLFSLIFIVSRQNNNHNRLCHNPM